MIWIDTDMKTPQFSITKEDACVNHSINELWMRFAVTMDHDC